MTFTDAIAAVRYHQSMAEAGWYYYEGDPANTNRYWDGVQWLGEPVAGTPQTAGGFDLIPPEESSVGDFYGVTTDIDPGYGAFDIVHGDQTEIRAQKAAVAAATAAEMQTYTIEFQGRLQRLIYFVSVFKVIPLFALTLVVLQLSSARDRLAASDQSALAKLLDAGVFIGLMLLLIPGALLVVQVLGAMARKAVVVVFPAIAMALMDLIVLFTVGLDAGDIARTLATSPGVDSPLGRFFSVSITGSAAMLMVATLVNFALQAMIAFWSGSLTFEMSTEQRHAEAAAQS